MWRLIIEINMPWRVGGLGNYILENLLPEICKNVMEVIQI